MIDLAERHTFKLPAKSRSLVELNSSDAVEQLSFEEPYYLLGEGSNTLFVDDFQGTVICNQLLGVCIEERKTDYLVTAAAGENWHNFVTDLRTRNIDGLENLALIPGSIGAAPVQNIGAYGVEVSTFIEQVTAWDIRAKRWVEMTRGDCEFAYRDSVFKQHPGRWLITSVVFRLPKNWQPVTHYSPLNELSGRVTAQNIFDKVIEVRQRKLPDPKVIPNAGSFFKNPIVAKDQLDELLKKWPDMVYFPVADNQVKVAAGWLIEQLGLKSEFVGEAAINPYQALVLINRGQASGHDVTQLAQKIMKQVADVSGIILEPEVRLVGQHGLIQLLVEK
ncbi:UDP-N-acetylmuramate dehydrogenase [Idiomarina ramblicola]|uniref:UDP-N-acetylenolpyruvoylglucosamine reductase n=1 Tax=Idiomarina ramblicola TaxID=263724 RepID=A0A432YTB0_9GAMM|nr:UDP-N-acetylmuramate dehydrogenase [Idiomarina ramblicola]RUO64887.1 UDP-N-acetylenolpyruvoylglucosamine reductase [Idiomarina ramblicola]